MGYLGSSYPIDDFSGGLNTVSSVVELELNEALDASNIVIGPRGTYFRTRNGNTELNGTALNSGANLQGLSYLKLESGSEFLFAVAGNKIFRDDDINGSFTDVTGALTVTAGQNNIWSMFTFNDTHIAFGGSPTSPDSPWKNTGSGNSTALGGSPPSAYGGFQANNRIFAFRTSADPSRIYWSILGNAENWTGTGSGFSDVWTSDNDSLTSAAILNTNIVLLFKNNSVHQMMINTLVNGAFPIFPLFKNVGCVGKHASVVADGLVYFIDSQARMVITDGQKIIESTDLPRLTNIDNIWDSVVTSRLPYIQGMRMQGEDYDHIRWLVSVDGSSTNNVSIVWDIPNQCWLRDLSGWKANVMTTTQVGVPYAGFYNGKVYRMDDSSTTEDASEGDVNISSYWISGWIKEKSMETIKQPRKALISYQSQNYGNIEFSWGFDFNSLQRTSTFNQTTSDGIWGTSVWGQFTWGGAEDLIRSVRLVGRGNVFQYRLRNIDFLMRINSLEFSGKTYGQKELSAR